MLRLFEKFDLMFVPGVAAIGYEATDDALDELKELAAIEVGSEFTCDKREIESRIGRTKPRRRTRVLVEGGLYFHRRAIPLRKFRTRQTDRGVLVSKYTKGSAKLIRSAFGPEIPRLGRGVFKRKSKSRTPIQRQPGVSLKKDKMALAAMDRVEQQAEAIFYKHAKKHADRAIAAATRGVTLYGQAIRITPVTVSTTTLGGRTQNL